MRPRGSLDGEEGGAHEARLGSGYAPQVANRACGRVRGTRGAGACGGHGHDSHSQEKPESSGLGPDASAGHAGDAVQTPEATGSPRAGEHARGQREDRSGGA